MTRSTPAVSFPLAPLGVVGVTGRPSAPASNGSVRKRPDREPAVERGTGVTCSAVRLRPRESDNKPRGKMDDTPFFSSPLISFKGPFPGSMRFADTQTPGTAWPIIRITKGRPKRARRFRIQRKTSAELPNKLATIPIEREREGKHQPARERKACYVQSPVSMASQRSEPVV